MLALLAGGADFRFEAGRRIRFERRGETLAIRPRAPGPVYDSPDRNSLGDKKPEVGP